MHPETYLDLHRQHALDLHREATARRLPPGPGTGHPAWLRGAVIRMWRPPTRRVHPAALPAPAVCCAPA